MSLEFKLVLVLSLIGFLSVSDGQIIEVGECDTSVNVPLFGQFNFDYVSLIIFN